MKSQRTWTLIRLFFYGLGCLSMGISIGLGDAFLLSLVRGGVLAMAVGASLVAVVNRYVPDTNPDEESDDEP